MRVHRSCGYLILIIVLIGCNVNKESSSRPTDSSLVDKGSQQNAANSLQNLENDSGSRLGTFTEVPEDLDGCGCFLYSTEVDEENGQLLFVGDGATPAAISLDKEIVRLNYINTGSNSDELSSSNGIKVIVKYSERNKVDDEGYRVRGTLEIQIRDEVIEAYFVGYCGC